MYCQNLLKEANKMLYNLNLFVKNEKAYDIFNKDHRLQTVPVINEYESAVVLPLRFYEEPRPWGRYKGGVIDKDGVFRAGLTRDVNRQTYCCSGYDVSDSEISYCDEEVYFGGVILPYFGHILLETLSRFWGIVEQDDKNKKIVFVLEKEQTVIPNYFWELMELLDIDRQRILIVTEPRRFKKIIVPDESFMMGPGFHEYFMKTINKIKSKLPDSPIKKVYCTRTVFKHDCINEEYFENFFKRQGFFVVAIEKLSLKDQLTIWKNVDQVACMAGTLSHMVLFSKPGTKITILNRTEYSISLQSFINQIALPECTFVDVYHNILPTDHNCRAFIVGPNECWKKYVQQSGCYEYNETDFDFDIGPHLKEYLTKWSQHYSNEAFFGFLASKTAKDFEERIYNEFHKK